jgi:microcystin-dependent protein
MSEPFLAEIQMFGFTFAPRGWAQCNGQLLPINQNQAVFSLLGTTYGGNGQTTFGLPDMRSRTPVHWGNTVQLGQAAGTENVTLSPNEIPAHNHQVLASSGAVSSGSPGGNYLATQPSESLFTTPANANGAMASQAGSLGAQPHSNIQPYIVLNFCIALQGIFPSRN